MDIFKLLYSSSIVFELSSLIIPFSSITITVDLFLLVGSQRLAPTFSLNWAIEFYIWLSFLFWGSREVRDSKNDLSNIFAGICLLLTGDFLSIKLLRLNWFIEPLFYGSGLWRECWFTSICFNFVFFAIELGSFCPPAEGCCPFKKKWEDFMLWDWSMFDSIF